jgi:hypothetical protein
MPEMLAFAACAAPAAFPELSRVMGTVLVNHDREGRGPRSTVGLNNHFIRILGPRPRSSTQAVSAVAMCMDGNHSSANDAQKMGTTFDYHPDPCIARRYSAPHPWDPGTPGLRPDPGTPRGTARHRRLRPEPGLPGPPGLAKPQISTISGSGVVGSLSKSRSPYNFSVPEGGPTIADLWLLPARPRQMPRLELHRFSSP